MSKQSWRGSTLLNPEPPVLVSCGGLEKPNLITIGWTGTICTQPSMVSISVRPERYSHHLIQESGQFAINLPTEALVRSGAIDVIVVDSVAALVPRAEIEGEMGDSHVGLQARLMSQALRKLAGAISKSNCVAIFINQLREKVGVMYGNPEVTPGGRALKFYSSVRIDIRRIETLKAGGEMIGSRTRAKVVKNKIAPPFREAEFDIMYGTGISKEGSVLDMAVQFNFVTKAGAWFTYDGERLGQGREAAKEKLRKTPELLAELEHKVRVACGLEFEDEPVGTIVDDVEFDSSSEA